MKLYIGTKQVTAMPMDLGEYNDLRGWTIPADEDPNKSGYFIQYPDGYKSWSPRGTFDAAYETNGNFSFGHAVWLLKQGSLVTRAGWNGKNMWLGLEWPSDTSEMTLPYIYMKTADHQFVPWLASQTDMLADDWGIHIEGTAE